MSGDRGNERQHQFSVVDSGQGATARCLLCGATDSRWACDRADLVAQVEAFGSALDALLTEFDEDAGMSVSIHTTARAREALSRVSRSEPAPPNDLFKQTRDILRAQANSEESAQ